jgi:hypothetical protein
MCFLPQTFKKVIMTTKRYFKKKGEFCWVPRLTSIILAARKQRLERITVQGQPGQKVHQTPSQLIKAALLPTATREDLGPGINERPYSKTTETKKARALLKW